MILSSWYLASQLASLAGSPRQEVWMSWSLRRTRFVSYNSCVQLMLGCCYVFVQVLMVTLLHCYTYGPVPLQWIQQRDDIQIYPSYILKEHQGCCHERDASKGQAVLELVSSLLPNSIVVVHMSHPWHFHRLPVQECCRKGLPRNVALGLAPATGPQKSPKRTKTPKFQSPKSARRYKESKTAQLRIPRHGMVMPGASVARWRSSLSKPETWHRCSQHWMPDRNSVVMQCQPTVANFTNRNITTIATYPTCMAAHSISGFF